MKLTNMSDVYKIEGTKITAREWDETLVPREMSMLETYGAVMVVYQLLKDYEEEELGQCFTTVEMVDSLTYYCDKSLNIQDGGFVVLDDDGNSIVLTSVFCVEDSRVLFGEAHYYDDEEEENPFIVRF